MRLTTGVGPLALLLAGTGAAAWAAVAPDGLPTALATRQALFSIPFRIDPSASGAAEVAEVQLYVSVDRGATWQFHSRTEPARGSFLFRSPLEGEYCFSIRTVNRVGHPLIEGRHRPGLRVLVDTTPPKLQLEVSSSKGGEISARWTIDELNLKPESFLIQYRTNPYQAWQTVAVDRGRWTTAGRVALGQVAWCPPAAWQRAEIRCEVGDTAGNTAVSHEQVRAAEDGELAASKPDSGPARSPQSGPPPGPTRLPPTTAERPAASSVGMSPVSPQASPSGDGLFSIQIHPGIRSQHVPAVARPTTTRAPSLPAGVRPRMVNTRRFHLEYDVESVGPSGIAQVELWGTRDGGQTWTSYGLDEDKRSPMLVTVNEEALFGFRVAVRSGAGLGGDPPKSGDPPEVWIGVDLTKPTCRIVAADQSAEGPAGQLILRWEAADAMLAERPVAVFYGATRDGPWTAIASGLDNSGQYAWTVEGRLPARIYLRLEVRDEAGNLGISESREPVSLDQLRPTVRIRQVRPFN